MSNIIDQILFEERHFRQIERGTPKRLLLSPEKYAELLESRNINPLQGIEHYHGMEVIVSEDVEELIIE